MVYRKPYGFLIKYFKIIHIILSLLMIYITERTYNLYKFFLSYIKAGWTSITLDEVKSYVNITSYISIVSILIILFIIYILMRFKKKPNLYYKIAILVYIITFAVFFISSKILTSAVVEIISPLNLRIYRDVSYILFFILLGFIVTPLLRGIGFDVKKFNFKKDIADLQINDLDSEEVEVNLKFNKHKLQRKLNKFGRNSTYIILRNKLMIYKALLAFVVISLVYFSINIFVINKIYSENKVVKLDSYSIRINDSYLTKYDSENNSISDSYKYIVVNFTPINNIENNTFNLDKVDLKIGKKYYYPEEVVYSDFKDIGVEYINQTLSTTNNLDYLMIFKIPNDQKTNRVILRYISEVKYKDGKQVNRYKNFKLSLKNDINNVLNIKRKLGNSIDINSNIFKVDKYELGNSFNYSYSQCDSENVCNDINKTLKSVYPNYTILKIVGEFKLKNKSTLHYYTDYDKYYDSMIYIEYTNKDGEKKKFDNIQSVTPTILLKNNNEFYFHVPNELVDASNFNLHVKYRNADYNIKLK